MTTLPPPLAPNRRPRHGLTALAFLALGFVAMAAMNRQAVQRLERLEITRDGHAMISLNTDENGGVIRLFNAAGAETLALRVGDDGGADLRLNDVDGARALTVRTGEQSIRITTSTKGRDLLVLDSAGGVPGPASELEGLRSSLAIMTSRVNSVDAAVKQLQREHDQLDRDIRDLRPGLTAKGALDRLQLDVQDLQRQQNSFDQDLRTIRDSATRYQRDYFDLDRRLRRLESRVP